MLKYITSCILFFFINFSHSFGQIKLLSGKKIDKAAIDKFLKAQMDSLNIKGISIAIINDGQIVYHQTLGITNVYTLDKVNNQTIFEAASMSKPVFAFFVMKLVEQNILSLDMPLYKYLPYPDVAYDDRYKLITARMVLDHTTGFPNWREDKDSLKLMYTPGSKFSYSGEGYEYLAKVIAHLENCNLKTLDSIFQNEITVPLRLHNTHFVINQYIAKNLAAGHLGNNIVYDDQRDRTSFDPAGGLYCESLNYAKFIMAIMNGKVLNKESMDEMLKEQVSLLSDDKRRVQFGITGWGLGFSIKPSQYGTNYLHGGNNWGYTSSFMFNREKKFGWVFLTNTDQCNDMKQRVEAFLTN